MEVIAKKKGIYPAGTTREPGERFDVPEAVAKKSSWMIPVAKPAPAPRPTPPAPQPEPPANPAPAGAPGPETAEAPKPQQDGGKPKGNRPSDSQAI